MRFDGKLQQVTKIISKRSSELKECVYKSKDEQYEVLYAIQTYIEQLAQSEQDDYIDKDEYEQLLLDEFKLSYMILLSSFTLKKQCKLYKWF